jgi:hypothetical protein
LDGYASIVEGQWEQLSELLIYNYSQAKLLFEPVSVLALTSAKPKIMKMKINIQNEEINLDIMGSLKKRGWN